MDMLKLSPYDFDQTEKGWRSLPDKEAVVIIEKYLKGHADVLEESRNPTIQTLRFHCGQCYAFLGEEFYEKAISWFSQSFDKPSDYPAEWWNYYVQGTIDYLKRDREGLVQSIES